MSEVGALTPEQLQSWRNEGKPFALLDVRSPKECEAAALLPAIQIPMDEIPGRLDEIPNGVPVVVMCHYGARSAQVAGFLAAMDFPDLYNLDGGIDAYASRVDPGIARY